MALSRFPRPVVFVLVLALLAGAAALAYSWWAGPLVDADRALAAGDKARGAAAYAEAERRFGMFQLTRLLFAGHHDAAVYNQLALLYDARQFDAVIEKAAAAPAGAAPRFWAGSALLARGLAESRSDARIVWLTRAEEELKQALQAAPDDWDTKFNYELAARLTAHLRRQPPKKGTTPLQLLRPQPAEPQPIRKVG